MNYERENTHPYIFLLMVPTQLQQGKHKEPAPEKAYNQYDRPTKGIQVLKFKISATLL